MNASNPSFIRLGYHTAGRSGRERFGGAEAYLRSLLRYLDFDRYRVTLFCPSDYPVEAVAQWAPPGGVRVQHIHGPGQGPEEWPAASAGITSAPPGRRLVRASWRALAPASAKRLAGAVRDVLRQRRTFRAARQDILHFNGAGCEPDVIAARLANVPRIVATYHRFPNPPEPGLGLVQRLIEECGFRCADRAIATSQAARHAWNQRLQRRASAMVVVHGGVDVDAYARAIDVGAVRAGLGFGPEDRLIAIVASLHPVKAHEDLIEAMAICVREAPAARLLIVGEGRRRAALERLVRERGLQGRVRFLGFRTDVADILRAVDIVALSSLQETFGISLVEALAAAKPIVATRVGGVPEVVGRSECGILVPSRDPAALAAALTALLRDRARAEAMGREGRRRARALFHERTMAERTFALYEELLGPGIPACLHERSRQTGMSAPPGPLSL